MGVLAVALAGLMPAFAGNIFYWQYNYNDATYHAWNDPVNWSLAKDSYSNPDNLVPGAADEIWAYGKNGTSTSSTYNKLGCFDLGGGECSFLGYSQGSAVGQTWKAWYLYVTNGTLRVKNVNYFTANAHGYEVWANARVILEKGDSTLFQTGSGGIDEKWTVKNGGTLEVYKKYVYMCDLVAKVEAGGRFVFSPETLGIMDNQRAATIDSWGTTEFPTGLDINDTAHRWGTKNKALYVKLHEGRMVFGGDFTKSLVENDAAGVLSFELMGGTLVASNDVAFVNTVTKWGNEVSAAMTGSATAEVLADSSLDMRLFTFADGVTLTKTGPGALIMDADLPSALAVNAGTLFFKAPLLSSAALQFGNGTTLKFGMPGNVLDAFANAANVRFTIDAAQFSVGATVVSSTDAALLATIAANFDLPAAYGSDVTVAIVGDALVLQQAAAHVFTATGEADLGTPEAWNDGIVPIGADVVLRGAQTIGVISSTTPAFKSITVESGAQLKVINDADLPALTIQNTAQLTIAAGAVATMTNGLAGVADATHVPVVEIAANATLSVGDAMKFKNVNLKVYGKLLYEKDVWFGTADANETAYFGMTADHGTIEMTVSTGTKYFVSPAAGGRVVVPEDIVLTSTQMAPALRASSMYCLVKIGYNNPTDEPFVLELDDTFLDLAGDSGVWGAGTLRCVNGAVFGKHLGIHHPGHTSAMNFFEKSKVELDSGAILQFTRGTSKPSFSPSEVGEQLVLKNGAQISLHETTGNGNAIAAVTEGTAYWNVAKKLNTYKEWPEITDTTAWMTDPLSGFRELQIAAGATFCLRSASVLQHNEFNRNFKIANVPMTGEGDFVVRNETPGYSFAATMVCGANTATGMATADVSADGNTLFFNDGANWAGTVEASGAVALTNITAAASPATVTFGTLKLTGAFPVRVWKTGTVTNDVVNFGALLANGGRISPVSADGAVAVDGDAYVLGLCPSSVVLDESKDYAARGWKLSLEATDDPSVKKAVLTRARNGLLLLFR